MFSLRVPGIGDEAKVAGEEEAVRRLERSPDFRVLRKLAVPALKPNAADDVGRGRRLVLLLDTETTGVDRERDVAIELSMLAVTYDDDGLHDVVAAFEGLEDPERPLSSDVVRLTGLTDADLRGRRIDREALAAFLRPASLVVAHNALFDRPFAERLHPAFASLPWACSLDEVAWSEGGAGGRRLDDLLRRQGFFHDGHRALSDCQALLAILKGRVAEGRPAAFSELLRSARRTTLEIRAAGAPFDARHKLKSRRYRWLDGTGGRPAWTTVVEEKELDAELAFLRAMLPPQARIPVRRLTAFNRYR